jgi:glycosyltransferase involved in cell wall biosynthesis
MYVIDDASTDDSLNAAICQSSDDRINVISRSKNVGAVFNQVQTIKSHCFPDDIVILLDGDDALVNNPQIFHMYNNLYDGSTEFTYGSCWSIVDNIPLVAQHYPSDVKNSKSYRQHKFNWNMPYTHLRTFRAKLLLDVDDSKFKNEIGEWYRAGGDCSIFYEAIERADPEKVKVVADIVYLYNDANPLNDYKVNGQEQTKNAERILKQ